MSRCVHYGPYDLSEYSSARSLRVCSPFLFYSFFKQVDWKLLGDYGYHVHTMTVAFIDILARIHYLLAFDLQFEFPNSSIWEYMNILQRSTSQMYQPSAFIS